MCEYLTAAREKKSVQGTGKTSESGSKFILGLFVTVCVPRQLLFSESKIYPIATKIILESLVFFSWVNTRREEEAESQKFECGKSVFLPQLAFHRSVDKSRMQVISWRSQSLEFLWRKSVKVNGKSKNTQKFTYRFQKNCRKVKENHGKSLRNFPFK